MANMKIYFSDVFGIDPDIVEDYGAFNISLINDLPLFIDPFLLFNSDKKEYQELHKNIIQYVRFLKEKSLYGKISKGLLQSWFLFPEVKQNWLGYSLVGNAGSGLGPEFAKSLNRNLNSIFSNFGDETITKGSHLEKLCLVKDGVGKDNISDFTTNLIKEFLLNYTQDFAKQYLEKDQVRRVAINKVRFNYNTNSWERGYFELPWYKGDFVILTPKDILTKDENWINRPELFNDFQNIADAISNKELRAQINNYFLKMIPEEPKKEEIRDGITAVIEKYPQLLDFYILHKELSGDEAISLSEKKVRFTEILFIKQLREFVSRLVSESDFYATSCDTYEETRQRVLFLKDVIENKGGHKLFYTGDVPIRRESDLQILFRLTWFATPSDVSREVNDGRGPVDFKISRGSFDKSLIEFKLAKNTQLKKNLKSQLEIYEKASDTNKSIKVILYFTEDELIRVKSILKELNMENDNDIILIDGISSNKPSGSKA